MSSVPGRSFEVVLTVSVAAETPEEAARLASAMIHGTHHVTVYDPGEGQEREVYSQRVRRK